LALFDPQTLTPIEERLALCRPFFLGVLYLYQYLHRGILYGR
jgi:hypothetical protein